jgi:Lecithin:cholesterol acyltransferase
MPSVTRPTVIIPGIEGSMLQNAYPISPATTWSTWTIGTSYVAAPDFDSLALGDDAAADRDERVVTRPDSLLSIAYAKLVTGLQSRTEAPAYLFPYDWRYSNGSTAKLLVGFIERLLLKKVPSLPAWDGKFDFVCHSMGGLILRAFLAEWMNAHGGAPAPIGRVVFIATPHHGSLNAAQALIVGEGLLPGAQKDMRKLARTFPSVYELLPPPGTHIMWAERDGVEVDLFQESNWQQNTTSAVPDRDGYDVQQQHLDAAGALLRSLPNPSDPKYGLSNDRMLVIYGAKPQSTLQTVVVGPAPVNWYDFANPRKDTGDDVVLVGSARLPGVASVAIQPDDIGWDLLGRVYGWVELHPFLPALDEVQTIASRFLQGETGTDLLPLNIAQATPSRFSP